MLRWEVPEGRWLIGLFSVTPGGICDKGDGPEVDPGSREAVLFHLNFMFSRLDPKLRRYYGTTLVDVASDSWEYERPPGGGRYWSPAILDAFPKEAGYDLRARMHALLGYGPEAAQVLHDLESVERQLVHSNFFGTVTGFLNERGLRHRPQAYGRGLARDLLFAYTLSDTPEIEPTLVLPEAPWAAHTTGKPIVSAEAFTFLGLYQNAGQEPRAQPARTLGSHARGAAPWPPTTTTAKGSTASRCTASVTRRPACRCPAGACMRRSTSIAMCPGGRSSGRSPLGWPASSGFSRPVGPSRTRWSIR